MRGDCIDVQAVDDVIAVGIAHHVSEMQPIAGHQVNIQSVDGAALRYIAGQGVEMKVEIAPRSAVARRIAFAAVGPFAIEIGTDRIGDSRVPEDFKSMCNRSVPIEPATVQVPVCVTEL